MGLTIHYNLSVSGAQTSEKVREALEILSDYARHLGCANVGQVGPACDLPDVTHKFHKVGRQQSIRYIPIHPTEGWAVMIEIGEGCEPFVLGLCKYPSKWRSQHGHSMRRWFPTKISSAWQFGWFCKTQFAGRHGPAHFIRCHKSVVSLLDFCRKAGLEVTVLDETGYWEKRDEAGLLETLCRNEALLAAFGGMLKDTADASRNLSVESAIFDYPNFEHLEHEGWERFGKLLAPLQKCARL